MKRSSTATGDKSNGQVARLALAPIWRDELWKTDPWNHLPPWDSSRKGNVAISRDRWPEVRLSGTARTRRRYHTRISRTTCRAGLSLGRRQACGLFTLFGGPRSAGAPQCQEGRGPSLVLFTPSDQRRRRRDANRRTILQRSYAYSHADRHLTGGELPPSLPSPSRQDSSRTCTVPAFGV